MRWDNFEERATAERKRITIFEDLLFQCVIADSCIDSLERFGTEHVPDLNFVIQLTECMEKEIAAVTLKIASIRIQQLMNLAAEHLRNDCHDKFSRLQQIRFLGEQVQLAVGTAGKSGGRAFKYSVSLLKVLLTEELVLTYCVVSLSALYCAMHIRVIYCNKLARSLCYKSIEGEEEKF